MPQGEISSEEIGIFLRMKYDEGILKALLGKIQQDPGLMPRLLAKTQDFKYGITSHGELCTSMCENQHGSFKCNKKTSGVKKGTWDYCSPAANMTHHGKVGYDC